ncbi:MAG: dTDP-4-dehydrorhamnose reductase [Bdellovibrionota bacterium]
MVNIWVIGQSGQLASCLKDLNLGYRFIGRSELDLANVENIRKFFASQTIKPDVILNTAAYTQVDKAETEREAAYAINALASEELASHCKRYFYVSTDYVYGGSNDRPYSETDPVAPVNYYGETKLAGENLARAANINTFVIRTSWLYSPYGVNFVKRMAELGATRPQLKVVNDQIGTPTWAPDLAKLLKQMIDRSNAQGSRALAPGIYNYSNEGRCSWYDLAVETLKASASKTQILPISTSEYPTPARRPAYSVLDKSKIKEALSLSIKNWRDSFSEAANILFK